MIKAIKMIMKPIKIKQKLNKLYRVNNPLLNLYKGDITLDDNFKKLKKIKEQKMSYNHLLKTEFCPGFVKKMQNRMIMSFFKYGPVEKSYKNGGIDALESASERIKEYKKTGNREYLVDAGNFIMCEYMYPQHKDEYFEGTDSNKSPGRIKRKNK
jgi:hypothetical protein